jgi:hypothetical protein
MVIVLMGVSKLHTNTNSLYSYWCFGYSFLYSVQNLQYNTVKPVDSNPAK